MKVAQNALPKQIGENYGNAFSTVNLRSTTGTF